MKLLIIVAKRNPACFDSELLLPLIEISGISELDSINPSTIIESKIKAYIKTHDCPA
jgi:hypothetical protein